MVRPSFAPHGPTSPVTLLFDDTGLTQLAGEPVVAWQTPWSEIAQLRFVRRRSSVTIIATIAHVIYQWRRIAPAERTSLEELARVLRAHGAHEVPRARRVGALVAVLLVSVASFAGYFGGLLSPSAPSPALTEVKAVNLSARDVAGTWGASLSNTDSVLGAIMPTPGEVIRTDPATTTTALAASSPLALVASHFQQCVGVASGADRVYGLAGVAPNYEVSSPVFSSNDDGGINVESVAQYYDAPQNVIDDVAEMSRASFGRCFADTDADLMVAAAQDPTPNLTSGVTYDVHTFARGWVRAGAITLSEPIVGLSHDTLVMVAEASGHFEAYMAVLVGDVAAARTTIDALANAMMLRVTSTSTTSA
jgi:hypothetical protein